jgi:hypothetical protein
MTAIMFLLRTEVETCGEIAVICDFPENCYFIIQDEAQGFHWNNAQATLYPFLAYY